MAKLLNFIGTALIIIVIILSLSLIVPRAFGISTYTVMTGSMEPAMPVGSMVYAKATDPQLLAEGDIIVFYDGRNEIPVTHRVVENQRDEGQLITKGDANSSNDISPIPYHNVIGKVVLHLPFLGRLMLPLSSMTGKIALFALILGGFLLCEVSRRMRRKTKA